MNYQEALNIIKKEKPDQLIRYCYEYDNKYIFTLSVDKTYVEGDLTLLDYSVDKETGNVEIFDFWKESLQNIFGESHTNLAESMRKTMRIVEQE